MLPVHTVLHPTDFSEPSDAAFRLACSLARDYGARLVLLHVVPPTVVYGEGAVVPDPELLVHEAKDQLDRLQVPDAAVHTDRRLEEGDPVGMILHVAREVHADLIVMGTHGRTGLARLLMGSVAGPVVRKATCPVLTVTAPFAPAPAEPHEETVSA